MPRKGVKCFKFGIYNAVDSRCSSFRLCVGMHMHPIVSARLIHMSETQESQGERNPTRRF